MPLPFTGHVAYLFFVAPRPRVCAQRGGRADRAAAEIDMGINWRRIAFCCAIFYLWYTAAWWAEALSATGLTDNFQ